MKKILFMLIALIVLITKANAQYTVAPISYNPFAYNSGTPVLIGVDDIWSSAVNIPFSFSFFGTSYNQVVIGGNGCVSFNISNAGGYCAWNYTSTCPNSNIVNGSTGPFILGAYHDMDLYIGGNIYYAVYGTSPYRSFVISWSSIPMFQCNTLLSTQQIVLYETYNYIDVNLQNKPLCSSWNAGNAVIGIQDASGNLGLSPPGRNTSQWSAVNEAWRFTPSLPIIGIVNIVDADCGSNNGSIITNVVGGIPPYSYLWNSVPPQTGPDLANVSPGYYCLSVTDMGGDTTVICELVDTVTYGTPDICMVSADTNNNFNNVIWEKPLTTGIDKYLIYRETAVAGLYNLIGMQDYGDYSNFVDSTSNSLQQSYKYKLAVLDKCGHVSSQSFYHQTMHLSVNAGISGGINLFWNFYNGYSHSTYNIYRGTNPNSLTLLSSVANTINSFTDLAPPSGIVYYRVEAVRAFPCSPSIKSGSAYNSAVSNIAYDEIVGVLENDFEDNILLFPNPASYFFTLSVDASVDFETTLFIYDIVGKLVDFEILKKNKEQVNVENLKNGIYFVKVKTNNLTYIKKLIINR